MSVRYDAYNKCCVKIRDPTVFVDINIVQRLSFELELAAMHINSYVTTVREDASGPRQ